MFLRNEFCVYTTSEKVYEETRACEGRTRATSQQAPQWQATEAAMTDDDDEVIRRDGDGS
jgi:hypothetical protein